MTTTKTAEEVIAQLGLKPHPEGGYFRETFRDEGAHKGRAHSTAILYLLRAGECRAGTASMRRSFGIGMAARRSCSK